MITSELGKEHGLGGQNQKLGFTVGTSVFALNPFFLSVLVGEGIYIYIIHSTSSLCYGHAEPASVSSVRSVRRPSSEAEEIFGSPFSEALADPDPHQSLQSIIYEIIHQNRSGLESCPHGVKSERLLKVMILEISAMGRLKGYCGKKSCKHLKH